MFEKEAEEYAEKHAFRVPYDGSNKFYDDKDNEEYYEQIRNLCKACGLSIDKIAKQFNINQNLVAKLFMETMQTILDKVEK